MSDHLQENSMMGVEGMYRTIVTLVLLLVGQTGAAIGQQLPDHLPKSLQLAPQDAAFYGSLLNLRQQWDQVLQSEPVKEIVAHPAVQRWTAGLEQEWKKAGGQAAQVRTMMRVPLVQDLLALLQEMATEEMFWFADSRMDGFLVECNKLMSEMTESLGSGNPEMLMRWFENLDKSRIDKIPVPTLVVGWKIDDQNRALGLLDQLQGIMLLGIGNVPGLNQVTDAFQRIEDDRGTRLVLQLSAEVVPWDLIPSGTDQQEVIFEKLQELLEGRTLTIGFGLLDEYLVMTVSEKAVQVKELGSGAPLSAHPHLADVLAAPPGKLTSIGYQSDASAKASFDVTWNRYFSRLYRSLAPALTLSNEGKLPEWLEPLEDDLEWLDSEIGQHVPEFKGYTSYSYLIDEGQEGWIQRRSRPVLLDGSKPLTILNHLGGEPMIFLAQRHQYRPEWFGSARKIVQKLRNYLEGLAESETVSASDAQRLSMLLDEQWPNLEQIANAWQDKFLPGTRDGQFAIAISSGNLAQRRWASLMPESSEALPFPEAMLVTGVSDSQLVEDGFVATYQAANQTVDVLRKINPGSIPADYSIPLPDHETISTGDRFFYPIPDSCPAPKEMAPQVRLGKQWLSIGYSDVQCGAAQEEVALKDRAFWWDGSQAMAGASHIHLGKILETLSPWVRYGVGQVFDGDLDRNLLERAPESLQLTAGELIEIIEPLKRLGSWTATTEAKDQGSMVHWRFLHTR
ncbi:MAG: hypothetical protein ACK5AM_08595 [Pirellulaceae bacterium]